MGIIPPTLPGVYKFTCLPTGKVYIGSTTNLQSRRRSHFNTLRRGVNRAVHLQYAWNKYGEQAFTFEIVECVMFAEDLIAREQYWLDYYQAYDRSKGFNIRTVADINLGWVPSEATRHRIRGTLDKYRSRIAESVHDLDLIPTSEVATILDCSQERVSQLFQRGKLTGCKIQGLVFIHKHCLSSLSPDDIIPLTREEVVRKSVLANKGRKTGPCPPTRAQAIALTKTRGRSYTITAPDGTVYTNIVNLRAFQREHGLSHLREVASGTRKTDRGWTAVASGLWLKLVPK